jgi:hypothetical protein
VVQKRHFPLILVVVLVAAFATAGVVGVTLAALGLAVIYWLSLHAHPRARHGRCGGSGEHHSWLFPWTHRKCGGCQGGRIIRRGAAIWGAEHIRHEHARGKAARRTAKSGGTWR